MTAPITNALTIDVEDWFQVSAFAPYIDRLEWNSRDCRVERNVGRILQLLDDAGTKATFFTLGWIAERYPQLVRGIVDNGHELASHGHAHLRASEQTEAGFYADIQLAKIVTEHGAALDSFYVVDGDGAKVRSLHRQQFIDARIREAIARVVE